MTPMWQPRWMHPRVWWGTFLLAILVLGIAPTLGTFFIDFTACIPDIRLTNTLDGDDDDDGDANVSIAVAWRFFISPGNIGLASASYENLSGPRGMKSMVQVLRC